MRVKMEAKDEDDAAQPSAAKRARVCIAQMPLHCVGAHTHCCMHSDTTQHTCIAAAHVAW